MALNQIADDKEVREFSQATSVETLTQRLEGTLAGDQLARTSAAKKAAARNGICFAMGTVLR